MQVAVDLDRLRARGLTIDDLRTALLQQNVEVPEGPGSGGRASMAKVIIGGQMLCLLLTLLVTPVSYSIFDDWGAGKFLLFRRRVARKEPGGGSAMPASASAA